MCHLAFCYKYMWIEAIPQVPLSDTSVLCGPDSWPQRLYLGQKTCKREWERRRRRVWRRGGVLKCQRCTGNLFTEELLTDNYFSRKSTSQRERPYHGSHKIICIPTSQFIPLSDALLLKAYEWTVKHGHNVRDMLNHCFMAPLERMNQSSVKRIKSESCIRTALDDDDDLFKTPRPRGQRKVTSTWLTPVRCAVNYCIVSLYSP